MRARGRKGKARGGVAANFARESGPWLFAKLERGFSRGTGQQKSPLDRAGCRNKLRPGGEPSLTQGGDERRFRSRRFKICFGEAGK